MEVAILKTYQNRRFIREMNRKWQKKYEAEQSWLDEFEDI